ncbi:S-layer homology domain-containing protein [Paenibacillus shenyangensis]|uniref:S-layer homology domain-containing protein n=1 Tax=Paenibacillus sp. A9 TaxID=1284352 RepID=UPI00035F537A|nr:S-layer homology domain-containing protein [Paenibacillus sp. A9]
MKRLGVLKKSAIMLLTAAVVCTTPVGLTTSVSAESASVDYSSNYTWVQMKPTTYPTGRTAPLMTYDPVNKYIILFGGLVSGVWSGETWKWDGQNWTKLTTATKPPARSGGGMAYDPNSHQVIMYGGDGGGTDTWAWTGTDWKKLLTAHNPGVRRIPYMSMAPDDNGGTNILLFGGLDSNNNEYSDTWIWTGTDWVLAGMNTGPSARSFGQMAYDPIHKNTVLFGGVGNNTFYNDTWTWDGSSWTKHTLSASHTPQARAGGGMAFDDSHIIMAGGDGSGTSLNDTWIWDGNQWEKQSLQSNFTSHAHLALAYDGKNGKIVMFGGFTSGVSALPRDTWILQNLPKVKTGIVEKVTSTSASLSGELLSAGKSPVQYAGIELNDGDLVTRQAAPDNQLGSYTLNVTDLKPDTNYTYRAYAIDVYGNVAYGDNVSFMTKKKSPLLLDSYNYSLKMGETHQTVAQSVYESDNSLFTITDGVTFSSQAPEIASVDDKGLVKGVAEGNTVVTAVYNGLTAQVTVNVYFMPPTLVNLSVDSESYTLRKGTTQSTVTRAVYDDGTNAVITSGLHYTSSDERIATIDSNGVITGRSKGSADITIEYAGKTFTIRVNVTEKDDSKNNNTTSGGGGGSVPSKPNPEPIAPPEVVIADPSTSEPIATLIKQEKDGKKTATIAVDSEKAIESLEKSNRSILVIHSDENADETHTQLDGTIAKWLDNKNGAIELQSPTGRYILPAKQLGVNELIVKNNAAASLSQLHLNVTVSAASTSAEQGIQNTAASKKVSLVGPAMNFGATSTYNGEQTQVPNFEQYAQRLIPLPAGYDPNRITTGIIYDENQTSFMHVPTQVVRIDGQYYAQINSLVSNGTYALIWNEKTFDDVTNHWGKAAIDNMASRLVVEGMNETTFDPNRQITRAEFSAIAVRAFGLQDDHAVGKSFTDVASGTWYTPYVGTASAYGLLNGYTDGSFKPDKTITRQEAISILIRAARLADINPSASSTTALNSYKDGVQTSGWAKQDVSYATEKGIMQGDAAGMLNSKGAVTRAETAALMERILKFAELI